MKQTYRRGVLGICAFFALALPLAAPADPTSVDLRAVDFGVAEGLPAHTLGDADLSHVQGRGVVANDGLAGMQQAVILWDEPHGRGGRPQNRISIASAGAGNEQSSVLIVGGH